MLALVALEAGAFPHENICCGLNRQCRRVSTVHPLPSSSTIHARQPKRREHTGSGADAVTVCERILSILDVPGSRTFHQQRAFSSTYGVSPLGFPEVPLSFKFRRCSPAGSDSHTPWDIPPGSETIPSCGSCGHHAHRSGRSWMSPARLHGRWHTGR